MDNFTLTDGQQEALEKSVEWYKNRSGQQIFRIYGYAGTGKTYLIERIVEALSKYVNQSDICFCTPTGKAASVLMQRFAYDNISTIHRLIYHTTNVETEVLGEDGKPTGKVMSRLIFTKKKELDCKLIMLDEVSMVGEDVMSDLLSYKKPIIAFGDPFQLPPVAGKKIDENEADVMLTEVVRQESDNEILKAASWIRSGRKLDYGNYGNQLLVLSKKEMSRDTILGMMMKADQVICGLNRTKNKINNQFRFELGRKGKTPEVGDKLICKMNDYDVEFGAYSLVNGMIGLCKKVYPTPGDNLLKFDFKPDFCDETVEELISDAGNFAGSQYAFDAHWLAYRLDQGHYVAKIRLEPGLKYENPKLYKELAQSEFIHRYVAIDETTINRFDYGYAISCHASQGSEFDNIVVFDESFAFREFAPNWLYTALTRAKKKVIVIR